MADLPATLVACHDIRNPARVSDVLARKGTSVSPAEVEAFLEHGVGEIHVAEPEPGDHSEDDAAARLAAAVAGRGVQCSPAHFGQVNLTSTARGMLRADTAALNRILELDGVLVITAEAERPVEPGTSVGVVKCAPLLLPEHTIHAVETIASEAGAVLELEPFRPMRVALVAPPERLRGAAFGRARTALSDALEWYGSILEPVIASDTTSDGFATAYRQARDARVDFIFAAGAAGTDPLDVVFEGLRQAGGRVEQIGIPAEPGTACWIGALGAIPVLGLASCELFGRPGALDLILPRLLTRETLNRAFLRSLALGGLLIGPSRVAPYHTPAPDGVVPAPAATS